jgi:hypothetical protein
MQVTQDRACMQGEQKQPPKQEEDMTKPIAKAAPEAHEGKYRWQFFQTPSFVEVPRSPPILQHAALVSLHACSSWLCQCCRPELLPPLHSALCIAALACKVKVRSKCHWQMDG